MDARDKILPVLRSGGRYVVELYNGRRPHSSLDGTTPDQAYFNLLPLRLAA
jgi:putative transposase